jgi:hypothetical protein
VYFVQPLNRTKQLHYIGKCNVVFLIRTHDTGLDYSLSNTMLCSYGVPAKSCLAHHTVMEL